jgi:hypothetical protein
MEQNRKSNQDRFFKRKVTLESPELNIMYLYSYKPVSSMEGWGKSVITELYQHGPAPSSTCACWHFAEGLPLFFFFERGSHCVTQAGLKLVIFLPLPPKRCGYRHVPPFLARFYFSVLSHWELSFNK